MICVKLTFRFADDVVDLSKQPSLRTLHIRNITSRSLELLVLLLDKRVSPENLTHLSLDLYISTLEELSYSQTRWSRLDTIFARVYSKLQLVQVWLRQVPQASSGDPQALRLLAEMVGEKMPTLRTEFKVLVQPWFVLIPLPVAPEMVRPDDADVLAPRDQAPCALTELPSFPTTPNSSDL